MSDKKKLEEISKALKAASATHLGHSKDLEKMQAKLDQVRYGKELFPGGKHTKSSGERKPIKTLGKKIIKKLKSMPSKQDKEFAEQRNQRREKQRIEQEEIAKSNSSVLNTEGYSDNFTLNQVSSAYLAGGNRPMNQIGTVQTGDTNAPNMGNFGGAMGMSGVPTRPIDPTTGMPMNYGMMQEKMSATEKAKKIDAIPGMPEEVKQNMKDDIKVDQVRLITRIENTAKDFQKAFDRNKTIEKDKTIKELGKEAGKFGSNMGTILPEIEITESKDGKYRAVKTPLFNKIGQDAKQRKSMRVKRKK